MKKFTKIALALSLTALTPSVFVQTAFAQSAQDDGIYPTSSIASVSEYVFRGVSLGGASIQPSTEIGTAFGVTVGAWYSAGLGADSAVQADEIDLYINYALPIEGPISAEVGGTYYHYPQFGSILETDDGLAGSYEVYGAVGLNDAPLSPKASVYYDLTLENLTLEGSLSHSLDLPRAGWSAGLGLTGGLVDSDAGFDYEWATATVSINKDVTDTIDFYISGNFTVNSEDDTLGFDRVIAQNGSDFAIRDSDTQFWFGTGLSVSY